MSGPPAIDMTGRRIGRLHVLGPAKSLPGKQHKYGAMWRCLCDCGQEAVRRGGNLRTGFVKSCGCIRSERMRYNNPRPK